MTREIRLGDPWTLDELAAVARGDARLVFPASARDRVERARAVVARLAESGDGAPNVYGVNTGFGALAETRIPHEMIRTLQRNLVRSHACGVGPALAEQAVRAMIAARAQTLAIRW